ncbi:MFS transporter [Burkholderia sp. MR1-5-21]
MQTSRQPAAQDAVLERAISRAKWRLVPFLILMYMLAYLDRANIGFAKQAYQASTGVSDAAFAFGAGIFFIAYALFEVPSNLMMHRVGARVWLSRIMVTWGLLSAATAYATTDSWFSFIRFVLGAAEAGLFPGAVLYMTHWFPARARGQIMGIFYFGSPLALMLGGPLSGYLLELDGTFGLHGWQLMFVVEGLLASLVGVWSYFYLCNRPQDAKWLSADEARALTAALAEEAREKQRTGKTSFRAALADPRLLHFALLYFCIQIAGYGVAFYLPTQVSALLHLKVGLHVGLVSAIPWACAIVAGAIYPGIAVKTGYRRTFAVISALSIAAGLTVSAHTGPVAAIIALSFVTMGIMTVQPIFWTFPAGYLGGAAAAGGFAVINAIGNLGGFVAPNVRAAAEAAFQSPSAGLHVLAASGIASALLIVSLRVRVARDADPERSEALQARG